MDIPLPNINSRVNFINLCLRKSPVAPDLDLDRVARLSEGFSKNDVIELCQRAAKLSIRRAIELAIARENSRCAGVEIGAEEDPLPFITVGDFNDALASCHPPRFAPSSSDNEINLTPTALSGPSTGPVQ